MKHFFYSCLVLTAFVLSACSTPRTAEMDRMVCNTPKTVAELLNCANGFGAVQNCEIRLALNADSGSCPGFTAWNIGDTVLVLTYADTTTSWRVANVQPDSGCWLQAGDPRAAGLSKREVIALYALPNCSGTNGTWWRNCSPENRCDCPCNYRMPADSVIRYIEKIVLPPAVRMEFGVAGANTWGPGGGLQWHLPDTNVSSFIVHTSDWE